MLPLAIKKGLYWYPTDKRRIRLMAVLSRIVSDKQWAHQKKVSPPRHLQHQEWGGDQQQEHAVSWIFLNPGKATNRLHYLLIIGNCLITDLLFFEKLHRHRPGRHSYHSFVFVYHSNIKLILITWQGVLRKKLNQRRWKLSGNACKKRT